jgi:hypothetical protein
VEKGSKPLTELLIDLAHDDELVARFVEDPSAVFAERGLTANPELVGELTLDKLQRVVAAEHEAEGKEAFVSLWIIAGKLPLPTPWIIATPPDEDEGDGGDATAT